LSAFQAYNYHLEGVAPGKKRDGAVFRALPVYRVSMKLYLTNCMLKAPGINLYGHPQK